MGFSLAGEETVIVVPEYNVCFDVGRAPREVIAIENICLSHGHMDHAAGIAYYFSQRTFVGIGPGRVIVHRDLAGAFQRLLGIWADIERHPSPGQIVGVEPLEDVQLRRGLLIRPFEVDHSACALGYSLIEHPPIEPSTSVGVVLGVSRAVQVLSQGMVKRSVHLPSPMRARATAKYLWLSCRARKPRRWIGLVLL